MFKINLSDINSFFISFFYKKVGEDALFNNYYESKKLNYLGRYKRFIIYKEASEPTKIPPMWHAWLHYMIDEVPLDINNFPWQQTHIVSTKPESKTVEPGYTRWKP
ncbi:NADH-ubiquinone oxidoreductase subunit NDUFA12 family protein [Rickettsia endosymbiont of Halotydeus destructor]|uniref:NADH-ubiquinone oxidoreductase subunit NDUFA12 family protein n=1 Tax=Rickettsia endosymbiont of Halotydeus destructor TaxID=2996754 RepID=UPI003BB03D78